MPPRAPQRSRSPAQVQATQQRAQPRPQQPQQQRPQSQQVQRGTERQRPTQQAQAGTHSRYSQGMQQAGVLPVRSRGPEEVKAPPVDRQQARRQELQHQARQALRQPGPVEAWNKASQSQQKQAQVRRQPPPRTTTTRAPLGPGRTELRAVVASRETRNAAARGKVAPYAGQGDVGDVGTYDEQQQIKSAETRRGGSGSFGGQRVHSFIGGIKAAAGEGSVAQALGARYSGSDNSAAVMAASGVSALTGARSKDSGKSKTERDIDKLMQGGGGGWGGLGKIGNFVGGAVGGAADLAGGAVNWTLRGGVAPELLKAGGGALGFVGDQFSKAGKNISQAPLIGGVVGAPFKAVGGILHTGETFAKGTSNILRAVGKAGDAFVGDPIGTTVGTAKALWKNKGAIASGIATVGWQILKEELTWKNLALNAGLLALTVATGGAAAPLATSIKAGTYGAKAAKWGNRAATAVKALDKGADAVRAVENAEDVVSGVKAVDKAADVARGVETAEDVASGAGQLGRADRALTSSWKGNLREGLWGPEKRLGPVERLQAKAANAISRGLPGKSVFGREISQSQADIAARMAGGQFGTSPGARLGMDVASRATPTSLNVWRAGRSVTRFGQFTTANTAMRIASHPAVGTALDKQGALTDAYHKYDKGDLRGAYQQVKDTGITKQLPDLDTINLKDIGKKVAPYAGMLAVGGLAAGVIGALASGKGGGSATTVDVKKKEPVAQTAVAGAPAFASFGGAGKSISASMTVEDPSDWKVHTPSVGIGASAGMPDVTPMAYGRGADTGWFPDVTPMPYGQQKDAPNLRGLTSGARSRPGTFGGDDRGRMALALRPDKVSAVNMGGGMQGQVRHKGGTDAVYVPPEPGHSLEGALKKMNLRPEDLRGREHEVLGV